MSGGDGKCRFFLPGPVWVRPELLAEMTRPMIGHRSHDFRVLFGGIVEKLKMLFGTDQHVFVSTSSGTGLMEAALLNAVHRSVLVTTCGAFSERWYSIAEHLGVETDHLEVEWGDSIRPADLEDRFRGRTHHHYDAVTVTHNETSTGVLNPLHELVGAVQRASKDTLILVDAVSSLGGAPLRFDELGIDVCLAGSQKALGLPPGLAVMAVSERAMEVAAAQTYRGTYFDFLEFRKGLEKGGTPFTPAISLLYALDRQLDHILDEGLENRWRRHEEMKEMVVSRSAAWAALAGDFEHLSPTVTALRPKYVSPGELLEEMKSRGYVLGSGYGAWKSSTFRVGHMGDVPMEDLEALLDVLDEVAGANG